MRRRIWGALVCSALASSVVCDAAVAGEQSFDSQGVHIGYIDEGAGEAIVLVHGFGLSADEMWMQAPFSPTPLIPELAKEYRVIAPDLRGHGASDKPHDSAAYGAEMAEDVVRLLDHLGVSRAHVVGYSMGATVAGKLLASHPERLLSVTFGGGGPVVRLSGEDADVIEATATSLEQGHGCVPLVMSLAPAKGPKPNPFQALMISNILLRGKDKLALAAVMRGQGGLVITEEELAESTVPILFVYGGREARCKLNRIAVAREILPQAEATEIEERDHVSTVASPKFREAVLTFIREHRDEGGAATDFEVQEVNLGAAPIPAASVTEPSAG